MERSVQEMHMHLKYLMKTEKEQEKKNQLVYQDSIKATTSRLNLLQAHLKVTLFKFSLKTRIKKKQNKRRRKPIKLRNIDRNKMK